MKHIDHIGIAVKDLNNAIAAYESLLNAKCYKRETVEEQKVETAFFETGESKVELLGATAEDSEIAQYLQKKGEGMHHVAFEVEDIRTEISRLKQEGYTVLGTPPLKGADNKLIAFVHPKDNSGVLVELCQSIRKPR